MIERAFFAGVGLLALGGSASASIPTLDAAQLDQHTGTSQTKVKLIGVVKQHQAARSGIRCAATTGQKGAVKDNGATASPAAGAKVVNSYAAAAPTRVDPSAKGAAYAAQVDGNATASVASGVVANQQTVSAANSNFSSASSKAGNSPTVMAAFDANTSARAQNGLTINQVAGAANLWAQALNIANLATVDQQSQAGASLSYPPVAASRSSCPSGMSGLGTATSPCVAANSICSTTQPGSTPEGACISQRHADTYGNVVYYLAFVQNGAAALTAEQIDAALAARVQSTQPK